MPRPTPINIKFADFKVRVENAIKNGARDAEVEELHAANITDFNIEEYRKFLREQIDLVLALLETERLALRERYVQYRRIFRELNESVLLPRAARVDDSINPRLNQKQLKDTLHSLMKHRANLKKVPVPPQPFREVHIDFDQEIQQEETPAEYSWNRPSKTGSRENSGNRLLQDRPAGPLADVNLSHVMNSVHSKLNDKTHASTEESKVEDRSHYKGDQYTQNLKESELVWDSKIDFQGKAGESLQIFRQSHHDNEWKRACNIIPGTTGPVALVTSADIVNAARTKNYTNNSEITDEMAMYNVVQKALDFTATSLVGTKINYKFASVRIKDEHGNRIDTPNDDDIRTLLNAAILALQSNVIPVFDEPVRRLLETQLATRGGAKADLVADYKKISQIQIAAQPKTKEAFKQAYELVTAWDATTPLNEAKLKRNKISKSV